MTKQYANGYSLADATNNKTGGVEIMTIKEMRELLGLTQAAFSEKYKIPKRTIEDWEAERRNPPSYVLYLLERVVTEDYNMASGLEKYAIDATRDYTMQLDEILNEEELIKNRFL